MKLSTLKPRVAHLRDVTARHDRLPKSDLDPNDPVVEVTPRNMWIWGITRCNDGGSATIYRGRHYRLGKVALKHLRPDKDHCTLVEVSEALAYIHDKGMIHGDVKSANVLVSDEEHALVCDLGLSRSTGTTTNAALKGDGSHNYQAPELFNGASKTAKSDVYAFGITIYEILSGQEWYISNIYGAVVTAVTKGGRPLTHNPATSPTGQSYAPVWEMAEKCWIHDPSARPTMKEVFQELRRLVGSVPNEVSSYRRDLGGV
ncbi:hypothetical protein FRB99_008753 [Tulasnella sp. 403]|nr:hypothetical protein FRB99_008753 [Tulasnella sp. 403]